MDSVYPVFFDLDLTLTASISGKALAVKALKSGLFKPSKILQAYIVSVLYKLHLIDQEAIISLMSGWVKGITEEKLDMLCERVCSEDLIPALYRDSLKEIDYHISQGAKVILLTSSLEQICQIIARHIGMHDYIGSRLEISNGELTGRPAGKFCFGAEKSVRMRQYCSENGLDIKRSWFYSDSITDMPALSDAGTAVCVNPDKKLNTEANLRGWKVVSWTAN